MNKILNNINSPEDIKNLSQNELIRLSVEIRQFLLEKISVTGGHLSSNLGVVELTIALHKSYNSPKDKIIWDVGHQGYVHKILTGRCNGFDTLRQKNGMSGFLKRIESSHDIFEAGHSSTSISAALGLAKARNYKKDDYDVIAVIGDGALTGGMAFEALNNLGDSKEKMTIVLNDNEMSIDENTGALVKYLSDIRTTSFYNKLKRGTSEFLYDIPKIGSHLANSVRKLKGSIKYIVVPGMLFEDLGITYIGPIDGHNIDEMTEAFSKAKTIDGPTMVHVITKKGKGYQMAEKNPDKYHGVNSFDIKTGIVPNGSATYSSVMGSSLIEICDERDDVVAITAAMPSGTGLSKFKQKHPDRLIDVGIAEQHGVTLSAGLSTGGMKPVVAVYSTFLQRAYDQILHDVCIQKLHVVFAIDRAGIVGNDGETHHGVFDIAYLGHIPNLTILSPKNGDELRSMMHFAIEEFNGPIAVRYPRGKTELTTDKHIPVSYESMAKPMLTEGRKDIVVLAIGNMYDVALKAKEVLKNEGVDITVANVQMIKPLLASSYDFLNEYTHVVTLEDHSIIGGFGSLINDLIINKMGIQNNKVLNLGLPDKFIEHGSIESIHEQYGLDPIGVSSAIKGFYRR